MRPFPSRFMPKTWASLELLIPNPSEQHVMTAVPLKAAQLATAIEHLRRITKRLQGHCPDVHPAQIEMEAPLQLLKLACKVPTISNHAV